MRFGYKVGVLRRSLSLAGTPGRCLARYGCDKDTSEEMQINHNRRGERHVGSALDNLADASAGDTVLC